MDVNSRATTRWVLVAGTGLVEGTPTSDIYAAAEVGKELARNRYGLVTGAWPGVDFLATKSFVEEISIQGLDPNDYLIQVVSPHRSIDHPYGTIVRTKEGPSEWFEAQKYADALIAIGGLGGTYKTWLSALHDSLPRFPIGGTEGDSKKAFFHTKELWEVIPIPGITIGQFEKIGQKIDSKESASEVARYITEELLWRTLDEVDAASREVSDREKSIFISYSRRDKDWVSRLRSIIRPYERKGLVSTWVDSDIETGVSWEYQLSAKLNSVDAAVLLVSPSFLNSKYVMEIELPTFHKRLEQGNFRMYWILLEQCNWKNIPLLSEIQAIGSTNEAINDCVSRSDEQCRLIEVANEITRSIENNA